MHTNILLHNKLKCLVSLKLHASAMSPLIDFLFTTSCSHNWLVVVGCLQRPELGSEISPFFSLLSLQVKYKLYQQSSLIQLLPCTVQYGALMVWTSQCMLHHLIKMFFFVINNIDFYRFCHTFHCRRRERLRQQLKQTVQAGQPLVGNQLVIIF